MTNATTPREIIEQGRANNMQSAKRLLEIERLEKLNDELLGSLKEMLEIFEEYAEDWDDDSTGVLALNNARAAIAKAEGK